MGEHNAEFFCHANTIVSSLLGKVLSVEVHHDDDWSKMPEIGRALKPAGLEENSFAVAMCPDLGKWALGVGGAYKNRENAAKLALCVATAQDTPHLQKTITDYPAFYQLCVNVGVCQRP